MARFRNPGFRIRRGAASNFGYAARSFDPAAIGFAAQRSPTSIRNRFVLPVDEDDRGHTMFSPIQFCMKHLSPSQLPVSQLPRPRSFSIAALALPLFLSGCALLSNAPSGSLSSEPTAMQGSLHGGQQSVAFATVQIWAVGATGYGSASTLFATTTTADDGNGTFGFTKAANTDSAYPSGGSTWACPASTDPYIYLTARGGNTQGTHNSGATNSAAGFLLAVGRCSTVTSTTFYLMNELTTVASMAALTQYFNPATETIGAPSSTLAQLGLTNAFAVLPSLIDIHAGTVPGDQMHDGTLSSVPDAVKMNTVADVIAACINSPSSSSSACSDLFANATPPSPSVTSQPAGAFPTATDVLQALYYMFTSLADGDTSRQATLYGLIAPQAPFQPTLSSAPTDWSIGISYFSTPGSAPCGGSDVFSPLQVVIGNNGNPTILSSFGTYSDSIQITPAGLTGSLTCYAGQDATQMTFDVAGNYWTAVDSSDLIESSTASGGWATPETPNSVISDGSGNIFYSGQSTGNVYEIAASSVPSTPFNGQKPTSASALIVTLPANVMNMIADASGNIWAACDDGFLYELVKASSYAATQAHDAGDSFPTGPSSLSVDATGHITFPYTSSGTQYLGHLSGSPGAYTFTTTIGAFANTGVSIDGAGNIWTANESTYTINNVNSGFITEQSSAGTNLIPGYGVTRPAASEEFPSGLVQNEVVMGPSNSIAVDLSGNLWVTTDFNNTFSASNGSQGVITEFVGSAVPVVSSYAYALSTNKVATKP